MKYLTHSVVALVFVSLAASPLGAHAASSRTTACVTDETCTASINAVTTSSKKPSISGTAEDLKKVYVTVSKDGVTKPVLSKSVKVSNDKWKTKVSKNLKDGAYTITVYAAKGDKTALDTETFTRGKKTSSSVGAASSTGSFSVSLVPLLMGGTARANQAVAVSYLKVINTGKENATLTGVTLAQRGTASASAVSSLTIKDDKDGSQGQASVSGTTTTVPTTSVFAPGQMKLFTIKAVMAGNTAAHVGKTLAYEVTGVTGGKAGFPIKGTTWVIGF